MVLPGREIQIAHQQDHAQEQAQPDLRQGGAEQRDIDAPQGEEHHKHADKQFGPSLPDTGVGLPVVLFHDRFHIGGRAGGGILRRSSVYGSFFTLFPKAHAAFLAFSPDSFTKRMTFHRFPWKLIHLVKPTRDCGGPGPPQPLGGFLSFFNRF